MSSALSEAIVADPENDQEKPEVIDTVVQGILLAARETRVATIRNSGTGSVWWCPFCDRSHQEMYRVCNSKDCMAEVEIASDQHADGRISQRATATKTVQTRLDVPPFLAGLLAHGATPEQLDAMEAAVKGELVEPRDMPDLTPESIHAATMQELERPTKAGLLELAEAIGWGGLSKDATKATLLAGLRDALPLPLVSLVLNEVRRRFA
tara:strand:+ start:3043 stop:3669 length:627 start_codon:yes stop_codon:yes gene_type:complete